MSEKNRFSKTKFFAGITGIIAVTLLISALLIPYFLSAESAKEFARHVDKLGVLGFALLLLIQVIQIILAFIPGEFVEFAAGLLFGTWIGFALCLAGALAGQYIVFRFVRKFDTRFVERFYSSGKLDRFKFLHNEKKLEYIAFLLFFIPGTPKDLLTYVFPLTKINMWRFLIIAAIARTPSIITSTYAGATLSDGNFLRTAVLYLIMGAVSLLGLIFNNKFTRSRDKS